LKCCGDPPSSGPIMVRGNYRIDMRAPLCAKMDGALITSKSRQRKSLPLRAGFWENQ